MFLLSVAVLQAQQRPNIIVILADDMGFSDAGCYGGEISTPNIDALARGGLRYRQFYNGARCCPSRAALMTGVYPHQAGMGWMAAADLGTPAYQGTLNEQSVTIAEVLRNAGYGTYMTGKWHLTNERKIDGMVTDSWPRQRGFDRYFGIIPGGSNYFTPQVYSDNRRYKAPGNFYLTDALSDSTTRFIDDHLIHRPADPFFMYVAYTAPHWPLHAYQEDIDRYRKQYLAGWDRVRQARFDKQKKIGLFAANTAMAPRDTVIQAWDRLSPEKKEEMANRMAIYAAQIAAMDRGIGRIITRLKEKNAFENTLILFMSDNGACAEYISSGKSKAVNGQEDTFESYRREWANVSSTPFKEYKHYTYEGGIATPLIVHWPAGINKSLQNSWVSGYGHLTDIMATCTDLAGTKYPLVFNGQQLHEPAGKSLSPHFKGKDNNRGRIFWEHEANIALREGRWKMVAKTDEGKRFNEKAIALYDLQADPTELRNLAAKQTDRTRTMYAAWKQWAGAIGAFPLDTREYNERIQAYRRRMNGDFGDNLGGWNLRGDARLGDVRVDHRNRLNSGKSAHVFVRTRAGQAAAFAMNWPFRARKGERFKIGLQGLGRGSGNLVIRLENTSGNQARVIDQTIRISDGQLGGSWQSVELPSDDTYRLSVCFGDLAAGTELWLDNIRLESVQN
ncbi:sulfatase [Pedobacter yulinensis]|uniref:Sulfatase n=2 Tax=Pedobacter yulinensis TaxID=2126353 RepID=A0A2T3HKA8_9SPHI|nr:sulfatase [Pedobacter yulinensis]